MLTEALFQPFTPVHFLVLFLMFLLNGIVLLLPKLAPGKHAVRNVAYAIAIFMLAQELVDRGGHYFLNREPLAHVLPFHLCGMSVFLVPVMLITRNQLLLEVLYYWGLGGALISLITPEVAFPFPHFLNVTFFTSHTLIITGVIYAILYYEMRPRPGSIVRVFLITATYAAIVAPLNVLLGTNYLYICKKPAGLSVLDFLGPWPWYLPGMILITCLVFGLLYMPYWIHDICHGKNGREQVTRPLDANE